MVTERDIERFLRAFWESRWDACEQMLAPDAVYEDPLLDEPVRGRAQILEVFKFCHKWARLDPQLRAVLGDGRRFCAELRVRGTVIESVESIPPTSLGKSFDFAEADVFDVESGMITRMSIYADLVTFQRQIA
jgi:steroid delta-isomerase-like uncharacterized protein